MNNSPILDDFASIFAPASAFLLQASVFSLIVLLFLVSPLWAESTLKPEQIPTILIEKGKNLTALKAIMSLNSIYDGGKSRQDVKGFLIYRRPSDFRFQGVGPAGNSLFELVIRATHFELYLPSDGKIIKGEKDCFARKFPDVAEIESLIPIMLLQWKDVRFDRLLSRDNEKIVIRLTFQGRVWGATLEPQNLFLKRLVRLSPHGNTDLTADFGDYSTGEDGWLPRRFEVQSPDGGWKTMVRISKIEANPFIVEKNFHLEPIFSTTTENCR